MEKCIIQKDIVDAFRAYYSALYNLQDDPLVKQPTDLSISDLESLSLPQLSEEQLAAPNALFFNQGNHTSHNHVP